MFESAIMITNVQSDKQALTPFKFLRLGVPGRYPVLVVIQRGVQSAAIRPVLLNFDQLWLTEFSEPSGFWCFTL